VSGPGATGEECAAPAPARAAATSAARMEESGFLTHGDHEPQHERRDGVMRVLAGEERGCRCSDVLSVGRASETDGGGSRGFSPPTDM
jgi:hypothetical protein